MQRIIWIIPFLIFTESLLCVEQESGLVQALDAWKVDGNRTQLQKMAKKKSSFTLENCVLVHTENFDSLAYYKLECNQRKYDNFLTWAKVRELPGREIRGFRILELMNVGNRVYIRFEPEESLEPVRKNLTTSVPEDPKATPKLQANTGLEYFLSIADKPRERKDFPKSLEVFFDNSCPLKFLFLDTSYKWEESTYFTFQVSCKPNSPYSLVRIPSDSDGYIRVDNSRKRDFKTGEKFLGKLKIDSIQKSQIVWKEAELFHE